MKHLLCTLLPVFFLQACKKNNGKPDTDTTYNITISTPGSEQGYLYVDGKYTGTLVPGTITIPTGRHTIGVALQNSWSYLRKEVDISAKSTVGFSLADKPVPKTWKALWIGLNETKENAAGSECSTHFSTSELDEAYNFFAWSLKEHFEKYTYGTTQWETERKDITTPIILSKESIGYTVEPSSITTLLPQIQPGIYDCIFVFWRESEGSCSFPGNYFGLAWSNPLADATKTGFVAVKFDAGNNIADKINDYKTNDPGVWIHEWLHTVGENFYQDVGLSLPEKESGFSVHAAETYHYTFPWMDWYRDFVSGRIPNHNGSPAYLGIGPEALLKCTVRETAAGSCK
ncbi:MAG: hypothetical protein IT250_11090 [Chitinophagaceae bacterium]|nr:hypothetical protein [Chitinophagaceae bacterium]